MNLFESKRNHEREPSGRELKRHLLKNIKEIRKIYSESANHPLSIGGFSVGMIEGNLTIWGDSSVFPDTLPGDCFKFTSTKHIYYSHALPWRERIFRRGRLEQLDQYTTIDHHGLIRRMEYDGPLSKLPLGDKRAIIFLTDKLIKKYHVSAEKQTIRRQQR